MRDFDHFKASHSPQLVSSGVPDYYWNCLFEKLNNEVFDAGEYFTIIEDADEESPRGEGVSVEVATAEEEETLPRKLSSSELANELVDGGIRSNSYKVFLNREEGLKANDPKSIFLVDHAWSYRLRDARTALETVPNLTNRMANLMHLQKATSGLSEREVQELILKEMFRYNQTYSVQSSSSNDIEDCMPIWYIMDEFGSRINHSDQPNFKMVPFFYADAGYALSLLFPLKDIADKEEVTRSYLGNTKYHRPEWKELYLLPWAEQDFSSRSIKFLEHGAEFFQQHCEQESLNTTMNPIARAEGKLKVYSEYSKINLFLKHDMFQVVDDDANADILWLCHHFKDYSALACQHPNRFVNQFPHEAVLTVKDLLAAVVHHQFGDADFDPASLECAPAWFPVTYNLQTELPQFVSYFQQREKRDMDNHYIIKPWNLARGLDTFVTNNLNCVVRSIESGPKIVCKYIEDPVLFHRKDVGWVKFDLRFIVLLKSVLPLEAYVYNNFWIRFANKPFSLDTLDDYEKHFTLMNYVSKDKTMQIFSDKFIEKFETMYPTNSWKQVQESINNVLRVSLEAACHLDAPRGVSPNPQSRAMYGVDVMFRWDNSNAGKKNVQPVLLEYNFMPDCERACDYYPDFMDVVFRTLFSDDLANLPVTKL